MYIIPYGTFKFYKYCSCSVCRLPYISTDSNNNSIPRIILSCTDSI